MFCNSFVAKCFVKKLIAFFMVSVLASLSCGQQVNLTLVDGMTLGPGVETRIKTLALEGSVNSRAEVTTLPILRFDDGLRRTHLNPKRVMDNPQPRDAQIKITFDSNLQQKVSGAPNRVTGIPGSGQTTPFDLFGRRYYLYPSPKGAVKFVQGITEATPSYLKVESLRTEKNELELDMRLPLDGLDSQTLQRILIQNADKNKTKDWLDIVTLLSQAERFLDAREMLVRSIHKFPELENQKSQLKQFDQLMADQLFTAAQAAQIAGQFEYSKLILENINKAVVSLETQLKVERRLQSLASDLKERDELVGWIQQDIAKLPDGEAKVSFARVAQEIADFISSDSATRFADYRRRRDDATLKPDQIAALAISGWIYGPTVGESNSSVVNSGVKARQLITEYLSAPVRNDQIIEQLRGLESGSPSLISKILEFMAPPMVTAAESEVLKSVPSSDATQTPAEMIIPGRYLLEVPQIGKNRGRTTRYMIQLPPEYNPYRRYPCVLTLPSEISSMEQQLEWWAGPFAPNSPGQRCIGEASRRGYIVVSPEWAEPKQPTYNFTENEHSAVLTPLRDAMSRFSIDSDRVFISGHFMGATAAWDIAFAHPDLWAGCIVIGGKASKYIIQYRENAIHVPTYFVAGDLDPGTLENGTTWDKYLERRQIDCLISIYQGRGHDHFQEELPRIMNWMSLPTKVRNPAPKNFTAFTSRAGDRFFWWFETEQLNPPDKLVHPLLYKPGVELKVEGSINVEANSIKMNAPAKTFTVWLSPEFIDFTRLITVQSKRVEPKPDIRVLLEDVRGRSDRQHPYWMRVDFPN